MQGTAADIIKKAMNSVQHWLQTDKAPARMIMQVHDELVFEVEKSAISDVSDQVISLMSNAATLAVPLKVDAGTGDNWHEAH
jgi:DNA polymerase-1